MVPALEAECLQIGRELRDVARCYPIDEACRIVNHSAKIGVQIRVALNAIVAECSEV